MRTTSLLALLALLAAPAAADQYSLRFDPTTLTLKVGEAGRFKVDYYEGGRLRFSRPSDYLTDVSPAGGALSIAGDRFEFVSQVPGLFKVDVRHDSGRALRGATGSIMIRVEAPPPPRPAVSRVSIYTREPRAAVTDQTLTLEPRQRLRLFSVVFDEHGRPIDDLRCRWTLSDPAGGGLEAEDGGVALIAGDQLDGRRLYTLTVSPPDSPVAASLRFRIWRDAPPDRPRPDWPQRGGALVLQIRGHGAQTWHAVEDGALVWVSARDQLSARVVRDGRRGERPELDAEWRPAGGVLATQPDREGARALSFSPAFGGGVLEIVDPRRGDKLTIRVIVVR